uniref:Uncharacterized protein n=1 Tax=Rhizophora mucronata TaxID=61149 RepID=A0A2P2NXN1_RHIMU
MGHDKHYENAINSLQYNQNRLIKNSFSFLLSFFPLQVIRSFSLTIVE